MLRQVQQEIMEIVSSHRHVAMWHSGGKDSLALAHMARKYASKITIIHNSIGQDGWEGHTENLIKTAKQWGYTKIEITHPSLSFDEYVDQYGWPSKIVPADMDGSFMTPSVSDNRLTSYWHCTLWRVIDPIFRLTRDIGADAFITGSRSEDAKAFELMGKIHDARNIVGMVRYNPLSHWPSSDVYAYIDYYGISLPPLYSQGKRHADFEFPDCRKCVLYNPKFAQWLKENRPDDFHEAKRKIEPTMTELYKKVSDHLNTVVFEV